MLCLVIAVNHLSQFSCLERYSGLKSLYGVDIRVLCEPELQNEAKTVLERKQLPTYDNLVALLRSTRGDLFTFVSGSRFDPTLFDDLAKCIPSCANDRSDVFVTESIYSTTKCVSSVDEAPWLFEICTSEVYLFSRRFLESLDLGYARASNLHSCVGHWLVEAQGITIFPQRSLSLLDSESETVRYPDRLIACIVRKLTEYSDRLESLGLNKYVARDLTAGFCDTLVDRYLGPVYQNVLTNGTRRDQKRLFVEMERWLNGIDRTLLNQVPSIPYYFVRNTIDRYLSLKIGVRRKHLRILKLIFKNMHYNFVLECCTKHKYLYPAALKAASWNSTIPIIWYLLKRKLRGKAGKRTQKANNMTANLQARG